MKYKADEELKTFSLIFCKLDILSGMDGFQLWRALMKKDYIMENG